jgi:molecular chaperone DnaK
MILIGIDLGTNNTVLSYFDGVLHVIDKPIPSVISIENNQVKIGNEALLTKNYHKNLKRRLTNNPKLLSVYQEFLIQIKNKIEKFLEDKETEYQVIVTVPAYFSESDKDITKRAVLGAGLPLLRLLAEPTAAGIAYGHFYHTIEEVVLVFDMGAGTTDLTLMRKVTDNSEENASNFYEVISLMGDVKFGGEDITDLLRQKFPLINDPEESKINLSSGDILEISQKDYFRLLENEYLTKITTLFDKILKDGHINKKEVNQIILVGGSTKNPFIRKVVENYFQKDLTHLIDPDTAVSFGATIYGNSIMTKTNNVVLIDRLPLSVGLEVEDGKYAKLIEKNTIIPTKKESYFTTQEDDQEYIEIKVFQGEHHYVKDNMLLGLFKVMIEPRPKCTPKICVLAEINVDGVLKITAKDKNNQETLQIKTTRDKNIDKYATILPFELYEEEFEMLNNIFNSMKTQILFQLTENIYLKLDAETREKRLNFFNSYDEKVESFKCNFPRLFELDTLPNNLDLMQENIIEMKEILKIINEEYSDYLSNYELENTKVDWTKKIETIVENIESYNLSEEQQNRILELAEQILTAENINVEEIFVEINQILGYNL